MNGDVLDQLRRENPLPGELPMLPIEPVLRRIEDVMPRRHASRRVRPRIHKLRRLALVVPVLVVAAVIGVVIVVSGQGTTNPAGPSRDATLIRYAQSQFAVFARRQTARDRSLGPLLARVEKRTHLGAGFDAQVLGETVPSLTRYAETLPDGREVFLTVKRPSSVLSRVAAATRRAIEQRYPPLLIVGTVIVDPTASGQDTQPISNSAGGTNAGDAWVIAAHPRVGACDGTTYDEVVPDKVARVKWVFPRQDQYGYVYKAPLAVTITAHNNVIATTIPGRASCDRPAVVTLYGHDGQVLHTSGTAKNLDRITRAVRKGKPNNRVAPGAHNTAP